MKRTCLKLHALKTFLKNSHIIKKYNLQIHNFYLKRKHFLIYGTKHHIISNTHAFVNYISSLWYKVLFFRFYDNLYRKASGQYFGNSHHHRPVSTTLGYSLGAPGGDSGTLIKPPSTNSLYPLRYGEMQSEYTTPTKTDPSYFIESHHSNSPGSGKPRLLQTPAHHQRFNESSITDTHFYNSNKYRGQYGGIIRGNMPTAGRRSSLSAIDRALRAGQHIGMETSIASLHSSGKDSGIVDGAHDHHNAQHLCHCGQSTSHSSEESSK